MTCPPEIGPSVALVFQPNARAQKRCHLGRVLKAHRVLPVPWLSATQKFESCELHQGVPSEHQNPGWGTTCAVANASAIGGIPVPTTPAQILATYTTHRPPRGEASHSSASRPSRNSFHFIMKRCNVSYTRSRVVSKRCSRSETKRSADGISGTKNGRRATPRFKLRGVWKEDRRASLHALIRSPRLLRRVQQEAPASKRRWTPRRRRWRTEILESPISSFGRAGRLRRSARFFCPSSHRMLRRSLNTQSQAAQQPTEPARPEQVAGVLVHDDRARLASLHRI